MRHGGRSPVCRMTFASRPSPRSHCSRCARPWRMVCRRRVALMDPAYGNDSKLRAGISELGLTYVAGILPTTMVWRPGEAPLPPASRSRPRPARQAVAP